MKKIFLPLLCIYFLYVFSFNCLSQTFQRTYGGTFSETATAIQSTLDGNYIISAMSNSFSNSYDDFYLLKVNSSGGVIWSKTYGGTNAEKPYYVSTCVDGGYIIAGSTNSFGNGNMDIYIVRTDSDGNLLWSKTVGGTAEDFGWHVTQANDGGFVVSGTTNSFGDGSYDGYLIKLNSSGNLLWTKTYGGSGSESLYGMKKTNDGGYITTGSTSTNSFGSTDIFLLKTNSNGDSLWTAVYGKNTEDQGWDVVQTNDGGYMIAGDIHTNPNAGAHNACLLKADSQGNLQWAKAYGGSPGSEVGYALHQETDNGYILMGNTNGFGNGSQDFFFVKTNSSGNLLWAKTYGNTDTDDIWYFAKTANEGNILVGGTGGGLVQFDVCMIRTDSLGNSSCNTTSPAFLVNTPVIQTKRGINVSSGGTITTPPTIVITPSTTIKDPCPLIGIDEKSNIETEVSIYPNPFSEMAVMEIKSTQVIEKTKFEMYDVFGKIVLNIEIIDSYSFIKRGNLSSGIYFYTLKSPLNTIATGKLIIQ